MSTTDERADESRAFPRAARLSAASDYRHVFAGSAKASDRHFVVLYRARADRRDGARLGLAIAKKRLRRSVDRNRIKRLVRESFRHWRVRLGDLDIVVLARDGLARRDNRELRASLDRLWQRLAQQADATKT